MKNKNVFNLVILIVFVVFSLVSFLAFREKNSLFYVGYGFSIIAFLLMTYAVYKNDQSKITINSKFLGLPIVYIAVIFVITQIILFYIIMFVNIPLIPSLIIYIILLGFNLVLLISTDVVIKRNENLEEKIKEKKNYLKEIEIDLELFIKKEQLENNKKLNNLIEKIKFSDPISSDELKDIEFKISNKIKELKITDDLNQVIKDVDLLLDERNKKALMLKK